MHVKVYDVKKYAKATERRKKKKPGKVIRVDAVAWAILEKKKRDGETISALIRRILGVTPRKGGGRVSRTFFLLPKAGVLLDCATIEEARGRAVLYAVRKKTEPERPIEVREVI